MNNIKEFKLRASSAGKMLTAKGALSNAETSKSYVKEWLISEITGKKKEINSKYLRRGNEMECKAIVRTAKYLNFELNKNETLFEDSFFTGTPDVLRGEYIIDTKVSWDAFTFPFFIPINEVSIIHIAQLQVYMHLTGISKAMLVHCLENGTEEQINNLSWKYANEKGYPEPTMECWEKAESDLNYDHLPDELRIKIHEFEYNETIIENLQSAVLFGRDYIENSLLPISKCTRQ